MVEPLTHRTRCAAVAASPTTQVPVVQALYFTLTAAALYFASDWLLQRAELHAGRRFESRSLVFFGIFLTLLLVCFGLVRVFAPD